MHCAQLYNSIWLDVLGQIAPCCFYKPQVEAGSQVIEVYRSKFEHARESMKNGAWPAECDFCQNQERDSGTSERTDYNQKMQDWGVATDKIKIHSIGIFLGNKCNLHCATCDPKYSTAWIKPAPLFDLRVMPPVTTDFTRLESLVPVLDDLRELNITGGEAMYQPELDQLIDFLSERIDLGKCKIRFATNGTLRPTDDQLERWHRFAAREITISADAYGNMFEYIRHPARWDIVESNIEFYKTMDIKLSSNCLISPMNVFDIDKIAQHHIKIFGPGLYFLGAQKRIWELWNIPNELKLVLEDKYKNLGYAKKLLSQISSPVQDHQAWADFRKFITQYDQQWGLSFADTFPEWSAIIKEHKLW